MVASDLGTVAMIAGGAGSNLLDRLIYEIVERWSTLDGMVEWPDSMRRRTAQPRITADLRICNQAPRSVPALTVVNRLRTLSVF